MQVEMYDLVRHDLAEITNLLHLAYAPLASEGFNYLAATQSPNMTKSRMDHGIGYVAVDGARIVGTITYYPVSTYAEDPDYYKQPGIAHFAQFAVLPKHQKCGIGEKLLAKIESQALWERKSEMACDTSEGATTLIDHYLKRGYRSVGYQHWSHACYRSIILSKALSADA